MNTVDKIINYFSPHSGLKRSMARLQEDAVRTFANSGYSESGASRTKKSMKGWTAKSKSPQEDIDKNLDTLRQRSRDLYMSAPLATSAIKTNRTNVVGSGLKLKARIDFEYLGITREQADKWEMNTEREFGLWAESVWCDTLRLNNFYELQQLALMSWLMEYAAITQLEKDERYHTYEGTRIPKIIANIGNDTMKYRLASRPIPKPYDVSSWVTMKVL